jgi:hypothetical protein
LELTVALLSRTPRTLEALLRDLPDAWALANEGEGTWSPWDVVGHLIHADRTLWLVRIHHILRVGEAQPFEPFQRRGHQQSSQGQSLGQLLDEFSRVRAEKLRELRGLNLQSADLQSRGHHPALGSVTLSNLLATWAAHDLDHVHQISRAMAGQYRQATGPWARYLGVLQCQGHGASA